MRRKLSNSTRRGTHTGRPFQPDFVVRSRANPQDVCTDHAEWDRMWRQAFAAMEGKGQVIGSAQKQQFVGFDPSARLEPIEIGAAG